MSKAKSLKVLVVLLPSPVLRSTRPPGGGRGGRGDVGYKYGSHGKRALDFFGGQIRNHIVKG